MRKRLLARTLQLLLTLGALWLLLPKPSLLDGISFSREVFDSHGQRLAVTLSADEKYRIYTPLRKIAPEVIRATLEHEDRYFETHPGFNPVSLVRAAGRYMSGHKRGGASTITMQLARLRYGLHTRSIGGKLNQILHALELERHYSKEEILEAYFNLAPYGGNLEGVGAASLALFRKSPAEISKYEALALSVIPQSPARRGPLRDRENPALQAEMVRKGGSEAGQFCVIYRGMPATEAPHYVRSILGKSTGREVKTTIDRDSQRMLVEVTSSYLRTQQRLDLQNASVILFDWQKMQTVAHLGSADFSNRSISGQVDGARALRSPGSTLKPLVYALAMQQGLIHPDSILLDAPRSFAGYNPENSDREFAGPIHASDALARSRNVPAVELSSRLHEPDLYQFLGQCGVHFPKPATWYGLSLPLGGGEARLEDLARLYAMLARNGEMNGHQNLTPEAAFLTLEMLRKTAPPNGYTLHEPVFWKTGTSHGYHDAWSVGVCGPYVLAVWVGNFDGHANPALMGRIAAAPLFFQILETLENAGQLPSVPHLPPAGANLCQVELCSVSGQLPGSHCKSHRPGWFIPGVSPIETCAVHQEIFIDCESGLRLLTDQGSRPVRREIFEFWPSDIQKLFAKAGLPRRQPPPFAPTDQTLNATGSTLKIISPRAGTIYTRQSNGVRELALRANFSPETKRLFWFDGAQFIGACAPEASLHWSPGAGAHQVVVIDQNGRQDVAKIQIEVVGNAG
ncbi:MAG: penicillin-binding protein 1C [Chthoniobacterales bacterium]